MFHRLLSPAQRGFTLVELAIVLGVVGVLSLGLWRILSAGSQQTKDQATAQQQLQLINAVQGYLADVSANSGQAWLQTSAFTPETVAGSPNLNFLPLPGSNSSVANCTSWYATNYAATPAYQGLCNYLPPGFTSATTNPYGQTYLVQVMGGPVAATPNQNYSFMIATTGGTTIPDTDGGRISTLIGSDGGFIYSSSAVCGATAPQACGTMGAWTIATTAYGFGSVSAGTIASRSFAASASNNSFFWLARTKMPSDPTFTYNSMSTDLYMAQPGNTTGSNIYMMNSASATPITGVQEIALGTAVITGDGPAGTVPQLELLAPTPTSTSVTPTNIVSLSSGCTLTNTTSFTSSNDGTGRVICNNALYISGDMGVSGQITGTKIYSASDMRLKKDILPLRNPLDELMKVDAVSFTFKEGGSKSMGVVAQDLEKVYPQLVTESGGTKYVEYNGLIGPLIGAVQELKRQNDDLRKQLHDQAERIRKLEKNDNP